MAKKVIILGGGVAGMSAAHELIERGFNVEVYEWGDIPGGKARSMPVLEPLGRLAGSDLGGRVFEKAPRTRGDEEAGQRKLPWLPGEHGFRFFPGFYRHIIDTMGRIPYGEGKVSDNLVNTTRVMLARYGGDSIVLPSRFPRTPGEIKSVLDFAQRILPGHGGLALHEIEFFIARLWQIATSCEERRLHEYEKIGWWEFIGAEERSEGYRKFFGHGLTRSLVASQAHLASTWTIGNIFLQLLFDIIDPTIPTTDRLLNGPTNDVWIEPWLDYLESRGVKYHFNCDVDSIHCVARTVRSVTIQNRQNGSTFEATGDYYLAALPVEHMAPMVTPSMIEADPQLAHLPELAKNVAWMNGIQFYIHRPLPITHGHVIYLDTPWALTSVSQAQFWSEKLSRYSDGDTGDIISVDISDWNTPGHNGKPARDCNFVAIKEEVWDQLKRSLNLEGREILRTQDLDSWFLDPDIILDTEDYEGVGNTEPLLVNLKDTWRLRPEAVTAIPNLFLASDYVRTYTDLATMEGANEAARRAVNGIIAVSGSNASPCSLWKLHEPEILQPLRDYDQTRWAAGLNWDDSSLKSGLPVLELVQKLTGISSDSIGYVPTSERSVGAMQEDRKFSTDSRSAHEQMLLRLFRQFLLQIGKLPAEAVTPSAALKPESIPRVTSPAPEAHNTMTAPPPPRRSRIRIVQKQS